MVGVLILAVDCVRKKTYYTRMESENVKKIVSMLGGNKAVAEMCEVTSQAVSIWKSQNRIPKSQRRYLSVLHPDLFGVGGNEH